MEEVARSVKEYILLFFIFCSEKGGDVATQHIEIWETDGNSHFNWITTYIWKYPFL